MVRVQERNKARPFSEKALQALIHGVLVLAYSFQKGHSFVWVIGPVTPALLAVTVAAALERKRLGSTWRWIHRLNYLIFVAVFLKAVAIGTDFKT